MREPMGTYWTTPNKNHGNNKTLDCIQSGMFEGSGLIGAVITAAFDLEQAGLDLAKGVEGSVINMLNSRVALWNVLSRLEAYGKEAEHNKVFLENIYE